MTGRDDEAELARRLVLRGRLSGATPEVRELEKRWCQWVGSRHALVTGSGTLALYAAYFGAGVGPGDEVVCPTYTWINTVGPAILLGARPVLCESDPETLLLDPEDVRRRLSPRTRAIVATHLWGNVCDLDALDAVAKDAGVALIEDCSHAHGARWRGRAVGTVGLAGCWSLQESKPIAAGEGGVLATDDAVVFERACILGQLSRMGTLTSAEHGWLQPWGLGMKLRPHPVGIAIAGLQLASLERANRARRAWIEELEKALSDVAGLRAVRVLPGAERAGFFGGVPFHHQPGSAGGPGTAELIAALNHAGVAATASPFPLLHLQPLFARGYDVFGHGRGPLGEGFQRYREGDLPRTERVFPHLVFVPVPAEPSQGTGEAVAQTIRQTVAALARQPH